MGLVTHPGPGAGPGSPTPRPRAKHLMDPNNPRPVHPRRETSVTTVQRWVLSVLVVTTIVHLSVGVVAAAFTIEEDRPGRGSGCSSSPPSSAWAPSSRAP